MCRAVSECRITSLHRHESCTDCDADHIAHYCDTGLDECTSCGELVCPICTATKCEDSAEGTHTMCRDGYEPRGAGEVRW